MNHFATLMLNAALLGPTTLVDLGYLAADSAGADATPALAPDSGGKPAPADPCLGATAVPALVTVQTAGPEQFVVRVTDQTVLDEMIDICLGASPQRIVVGTLLTGSDGYNRDALNDVIWSWHLDEETVGLAEVTMELCSGTPSFVEGELFYWLGTVGCYCPWSSQIVAVAADTSIPGDFNIDGDVDLADFADLQAAIASPAQVCYGGDVRGTVDLGADDTCCAVDLDADTFITLDDHTLFQAAITGP